jgi:hypothetical protein
MGLVVIFIMLRVIDGFFFLSLTDTPSNMIVAAFVLAAMWTTALLVAIWLRQGWARIIMIGLFIIGTIAGMILIPTASNNTPLLTAYIVAAMISAGCAAWLIMSRDMHRLISRDRE